MNPANQRRPLLGRVWVLPLVIALGAAIAVAIIKSQPVMEHQAKPQPPTPARAVELQRHDVRPSVIGFGSVTPDVLLDMRAEIAGKVSYVHPQLKKGVILPADTLVIEIDDSDYRLALKKATATLAQNRANLAEQQLALKDAEQDLQLAKQKLQLAETELVRFEKLLTRGSVAKSSVDNQRSAVLQTQQEVQTLQNQLDVMPHTTEVLEAQIEIAEAEVQTQQLNLQRTQIRLPFNARIAGLSVEANQFVGQGASLFSAQTINKVLINAQFPLAKIRFLARGFDLKPNEMKALFDSGEDPSGLLQRLGLSARVRLAGDELPVSWNGKVERFSSNLDPVSRTVGVIIGVEDPYQQIQPGIKPPLIDGMYMEVELQGRPQPYWVVPRDALHEGELYLTGPQQQLHRMAVSGFAQQQMLLLDPNTAIAAETRVITSDLFPAVDGMPLALSPDPDTQALMQDWLEAH
ncbi:hypothetical protein DV711_17355 [Motiliproteus coralliicola]|uniref:HlyD family efflux transporter periplasmic adaptor subunit n=1 Tax=Motiliproteus coralliicola TaxID=2283196 RepID=A0A369W9S2_9GAMM|nr:HlyD family secretion protein [Motiliproteus coralliicola]RDE18417.1 hypothetical protein DV711_17355 [Motiliproteus coralliicola]